MLKKFILIIGISVIATAASAQKMFATKTANIRFYSKTPAEDIEATNSQVVSKLSDKGQLMFQLLIKGFKFENELMQEHFNSADWMDSDKFPKASFTGNVANISTVNFLKDGNYPVNVTGNLTIRGITKKVNASGSIAIAKGKVSSSSVFKLKVKDYGITGKDIGKSIANELEITVNSKYD